MYIQSIATNKKAIIKKKENTKVPRKIITKIEINKTIPESVKSKTDSSGTPNVDNYLNNMDNLSSCSMKYSIPLRSVANFSQSIHDLPMNRSKNKHSCGDKGIKEVNDVRTMKIADIPQYNDCPNNRYYNTLSSDHGCNRAL